MKCLYFARSNPLNTTINTPVSGQTDPHMYKVDFSHFFIIRSHEKIIYLEIALTVDPNGVI